MLAATAVVLGTVAVLALPYAEWTDARGEVLNGGGKLDVRTPRAGSLIKVVKRPGQSVTRGEIIAFYRPADGGATDEGDLNSMERSLIQQIRLLRRLEAETSRKADLDRLTARDAEQDAAVSAGSTAKVLISARDAVERAAAMFRAKEELAAKGYLSKADLTEAARQLAQERERLLELSDRGTAANARVREQRRAYEQALVAQNIELDRYRQQSAQIEDQLHRLSSERLAPIRASGTGRLVDFQVRPGEYLASGALVAAVLPARSALQVRLNADARVASLVRIGDPVRISLDAFPHQQFGWFSARVITVDVAGSQRNPADGQAYTSGSTTIFRIVAQLTKSSVPAYGRNVPIRIGTGASAEFKTRQQSVLRWIIEPISSTFSQ